MWTTYVSPAQCLDSNNRCISIFRVNLGGSMQVREEEIGLEVEDGTMAVFLYRPVDRRPMPAIVMVHDANGLTADARSQARWLAEKGYLVAAPDTFYRAGRLMTMAGLGGGPEAMRRTREGMTNNGNRNDMARLAEYLREQPDATNRIGITGFCLGGRIAYMSATLGSTFDATVAFYPTRLRESDPVITDSPRPIDEAAGITNPVLLFFPQLDTYNPMEGVNIIRAASSNAHREMETVWVEGADHGFAQPASAKYNPELSETAWTKALKFFSEHLDPEPQEARAAR